MTNFSIEARGLHKTFRSSNQLVKALDGVTLRVEPGEIFGFVGANGAGKSTTMRIIMGVMNADDGEVLLNGVPATAKVRENIGYMPAERGLYAKMKVKEQLIYFARLSGFSRRDAGIRAVDLIEQLDLGEYATKKIEDLSTGNMQRAQLATALISGPDALILDEPFSGLDPIAVANFSRILRTHAQNGAAIIFSSHQLETVDKLSDKVGVIQKGKMIASGTPNELRQFAHREYGSPLEVTIPTPLADIFGEIVASDGDHVAGHLADQPTRHSTELLEEQLTNRNVEVSNA